MYDSRDTTDARSKKRAVRTAGIIRPNRGGFYHPPSRTHGEVAKQAARHKSNTLPVVVDNVLKGQKRGKVLFHQKVIGTETSIGLGVVVPVRAVSSGAGYYDDMGPV